MKLDVVTLFPEFFSAPLSVGLVGQAIAAGSAQVGFVDPRSFTRDKHRTVDDAPYGGGAGMVMKPEPLVAAIESVRREQSRVVLLSPQGRPLVQQDLHRWSKLEHLVLVAGRYEGFDERVRSFAGEEISLGDFVLTGGEYAALAIIDGVVRLLPGTLGNEASPEADSFSAGLLEHAQYTRPQNFRGLEVPEVLLSGDHERIAHERRRDGLSRTRERRPDLLKQRGFSEADRALLKATPSRLPKIAVLWLPDEDDDAPIAEWARLIAAYNVDTFAIGVSAEMQVELQSKLERLAAMVQIPPENTRGSKKAQLKLAGARSEALALKDALNRMVAVPRGAAGLEALRGHLGAAARVVRARAAAGEGAVGPAALLGAAPILLVFGPGSADLEGVEDFAAIRGAGARSDLGKAAALAVVLDRLIGEG